MWCQKPCIIVTIFFHRTVDWRVILTTMGAVVAKNPNVLDVNYEIFAVLFMKNFPVSHNSFHVNQMGQTDFCFCLEGLFCINLLIWKINPLTCWKYLLLMVWRCYHSKRCPKDRQYFNASFVKYDQFPKFLQNVIINLITFVRFWFMLGQWWENFTWRELFIRNLFKVFLLKCKIYAWQHFSTELKF